MKRWLSVLLCAALLLPVCFCRAESAPVFDESIWEGKQGFTRADDGSWRYEATGSTMYPPIYDITVTISVEGVHGGPVSAPVLTVGISRNGKDNPTEEVSRVEFAAGTNVYGYRKMIIGDGVSTVPLYQKGLKLLEFIGGASQLTVVVYFDGGKQNINLLGPIFLNALKPLVKDLLDAGYMDYVTDESGELARLETEYPLSYRTTPK